MNVEVPKVAVAYKINKEVFKDLNPPSGRMDIIKYNRKGVFI